jgi:hypothetical protein
MIPMAKFSRLLFGGMVGAGLAYLFSRKDVRRRLMGGGQAQLPAPGAPRNIPVTVPKPVAPQRIAGGSAAGEAPVEELQLPCEQVGSAVRQAEADRGNPALVEEQL